MLPRTGRVGILQAHVIFEIHLELEWQAGRARPASRSQEAVPVLEAEVHLQVGMLLDFKKPSQVSDLLQTLLLIASLPSKHNMPSRVILSDRYMRMSSFRSTTLSADTERDLLAAPNNTCRFDMWRLDLFLGTVTRTMIFTSNLAGNMSR
jgi:hypothetical protein